MLRKVDTIDRNLIALLIEDARTSISDLSRNLGVARSTITERLARLEQDGVILGYRAVVRQEENLPEVRTYVQLSCDLASRKRVVKNLHSFPEIVECASVSGQFDLICTVITPCAEDIDALIEDLSAIEGINTVDTTFVLSNKFSRSLN